MPLLVDRPPIFAHRFASLDPLLDSGEGGSGAVLEGEESILDESDGSHFDRMVGVCVLVNFLKSDESAKGVGIFVSVFNAVVTASRPSHLCEVSNILICYVRGPRSHGK